MIKDKYRVDKYIFVILLFMALISIGKGFVNSHRAIGDFNNVELTINTFMERRLYDAQYFQHLAFYFLPLYPFSPKMAKTVFNILNILMTIGIGWLLKKCFWSRMSNRRAIGLFLIWISSAQWRTQISQGQLTIMALFFFMAAVFYMKKHPVISGMLLSVALVKYTVTVPLFFYFIYKRQLKPIIVCGLIHISQVLFMMFWISTDILTLLVEPVRLSTNLLVNEGFIDISKIIGNPCASLTVTIIILFFLLFFSIFADQGNDELILAFLSVGALVMVYHHGYDYIILIFLMGYIEYIISMNLERRIGNWRRNKGDLIGCSLSIASIIMIYFVTTITKETKFFLTSTAILFYPATIWLMIKMFKCIKFTKSNVR